MGEDTSPHASARGCGDRISREPSVVDESTAEAHRGKIPRPTGPTSRNDSATPDQTANGPGMARSGLKKPSSIEGEARAVRLRASAPVVIGAVPIARGHRGMPRLGVAPERPGFAAARLRRVPGNAAAGSELHRLAIRHLVVACRASTRHRSGRSSHKIRPVPNDAHNKTVPRQIRRVLPQERRRSRSRAGSLPASPPRQLFRHC